jgi:hypothetical protein
MKYDELMQCIEDAILKKQEQELGEDGATAIYIALKPVMPEAAEMLGLKLGEFAGYSCSTTVNAEKQVGKVCFPIGDLSCELVRFATASGEEQQNYKSPIEKTTKDEFLKSGTISYVEIRSDPPDLGDIKEKVWCEVFVGGCDTLPTNECIKRSIYDGLKSLREYVRNNSKKLYVSP